MGTSRYEKRGIAVKVPHWVKENCIQCNQCSLVCPHAVIRPFVVDDETLKDAPEGFDTLTAIGKEFSGKKYRMQVSPLDCTGCGNCADICPGRKGEKALVMEPLDSQMDEQPLFDYAIKLPPTPGGYNQAQRQEFPVQAAPLRILRSLRRLW